MLRWWAGSSPGMISNAKLIMIHTVYIPLNSQGSTWTCRSSTAQAAQLHTKRIGKPKGLCLGLGWFWCQRSSKSITVAVGTGRSKRQAPDLPALHLHQEKPRRLGNWLGTWRILKTWKMTWKMIWFLILLLEFKRLILHTDAHHCNIPAASEATTHPHYMRWVHLQVHQATWRAV